MNILKSLFGSSGASLTAAEAKSRLDTDNSLFLLDVRQPEEFRAGHITGATLVPLNQLGESLKKLPKDREISASVIPVRAAAPPFASLPAQAITRSICAAG